MNRAQRCEMHNLSCSGGWKGPRVESGGHFGQVDSARNFKEAWVLSMTSQRRGRPLSGTKVSARALRKRGCRAPGDLTPCLNGDVFLGDTTGTRIRSLQLQPLRRASASDGVHRASAGSERGTCTCGRAHRARARRYLRSVGSCGEVSHSSSSRVRHASASDGGHRASAGSERGICT